MLCAEDVEEVQTCALCGRGAFVKQLDAPPWRLLRCTACSIVFTSPRLTETALARHYQQGYYEGTAQYFAGQSAAPHSDHRALVLEVSRLVRNPHPTSLDIGCGGGQLVQAFAEGGFSARGTEPSQSACKVANELGRNVTNAALETFPDASFDCVTAMHVLEHVSQPRSFLSEVARITRPNGVVVIEVPDFGCRASRTLGAKWLPLYPDTHLFHYTATTLARAMRNAGITPLRTRHLGGLGLLAVQRPESGHKATAGKSHQHAGSQRSLKHYLKTAAWGMRAPILKLPGMRPFIRWFFWECLGHGEYVRVIGRKTND